MRVHALEKAVASNERSLLSARKGFTLGGTSTNSDGWPWVFNESAVAPDLTSAASTSTWPCDHSPDFI